MIDYDRITQKHDHSIIYILHNTSLEMVLDLKDLEGRHLKK